MPQALQKMPASPEPVTGTQQPEVPAKFVLEAADIAVVVVYFVFVLAVGIWASESLQPLWQYLHLCGEFGMSNF